MEPGNFFVFCDIKSGVTPKNVGAAGLLLVYSKASTTVTGMLKNPLLRAGFEQRAYPDP